MTRPYPLEWDQSHIPQVQATYVAFVRWQELTKPAYLLLSGNVVDNDATMARLFFGTLKGGSGAFPTNPTLGLT